MFGRKWEAADATIIAKHPRSTAAGYEQRYDYVIDVHPADAEAFRTTIHEGFLGPKGGFADPEIGATVGVLYEPKSRKVKFDNADPRLMSAPEFQSTEARFAEAASALPGTSPIDADPLVDLGVAVSPAHEDIGTRASDPGARLRELEELRAEGLISEDEYTAQRQKIIDGI